MIATIFLSSYFLGMLFKIFLDILFNDDEHDEHYEQDEHFFHYYDLKDTNSIRMTLVLTYYAFTSLSTVGFGDYCPRSSNERIFVSISLFIGVSLFSYILRGFINMLDKMNNFNSDFE